MPEIFSTEVCGGRLALWRMTESGEELLASAHPDDAASCSGFGSAARRAERLAWRALARTMLPPGVSITYDRRGAPMVAGTAGDTYISASHCRGYAAVIVSRRPCAIDIENSGKDFGKVARRYVSPGERTMEEAWGADFEGAVWCAKEALYKYSGREGLDFLSDLRLTAMDGVAGTALGSICGGTPTEVRFARFEDILIAYI